MRFRGTAARSFEPSGKLRFAALLLPTLIIYTEVLRQTYQNKVSPVYSYLGERYRTPELLPYLMSFALLYLVGLLLPRRATDASKFILWILYVLLVVPIMLVPYYADVATPDKATVISLLGGVTFVGINAIIHALPDDITPIMPAPAQIFWIGIAILTTLSYAYIFSVTQFHIASLDLTKVYSIRDTYRDTVVSSGPLLGYVVRLQGNVINPFILTRGFTGGSKYLILAGTLGQFIIFSVTGYKITILSVLAIFLLVAYLRRRPNPSGLTVGIGAVAVVIVAVGVDVVRNTTSMTAIFVYRFILISGNLPSAYFQVFSGQPHVQWHNSFLSFLGSSPFGKSPGYIVGEYMTGNNQVVANSNYVADGYVNLGYAGIVIEAVVCALVIAVSASAARRLPFPVAAGVLFTPVIALVNSSPITAILSNGFALATVLFMLAPSSMWEKSTNDDISSKSEVLVSKPVKGDGKRPPALRGTRRR
jgi:hypothetical protein